MKTYRMKPALVLGLIVLAGCGQPAPVTEKEKKGKDVAQATPKDDKADPGHGWWCDEHGVIEAECSMCQKKVYRALKPEEKCPKHQDRAAAQCFVCNPELWERSKAAYVAKYGKEPPEPTENMPGKK